MALRKLFIQHPLYVRPGLGREQNDFCLPWETGIHLLGVRFLCCWVRGDEALGTQVGMGGVGWSRVQEAPSLESPSFPLPFRNLCPRPTAFPPDSFQYRALPESPGFRRGLRAEALPRVRPVPSRPRARVPGPHGGFDAVRAPPAALGPQRAAGGAVQPGGAGEAVLRGDGER